MKIVISVLISLLATAPVAAQAQRIFKCKDASGRTLTSERPIAECVGEVKEMDKNGIVRRVIPAPLTAEQKRQKELEEEKRKAQEAAAAEQKKNDRAILARFRNENDIESARKRTAEAVQEHIKRESASLATAEKRKKDAEVQLAQAKSRKDAAAVATATHNVEEADQAAAGIRKKIKDYQAELAQVNERFDATLKRYRELNATTAAKK